MIDRERVERAAGLFRAPEGSFDRLVRRRDRKERNRRITAGVVGAAIALAGFLVGMSVLRSETVPGTETPSPTPDGPLLRHEGEVLVINEARLEAVDPGTGATRLLVAAPFPQSAAWSPDGRSVAYSVPCPPGSQGDLSPCEQPEARQAGIWVKDALGDPQQLTSYFGLVGVSVTEGTAPAVTGFAWSPDGSRIAYAQPGADPGLYVASADGTLRTLLRGTETAGAVAPAWSPDGSLIAYALGGQIYVVTPDGEAPRPLSDGVGPLAWSPDGTKIAFTLEGGIDVVNVDGSGLTRIGDGYEFAWSPDGTRIAYHVERQEGADTFAEELWVVSPDGSDPTSVLPLGCCPSGIVDETLTWSPNGNRLAFVDYGSGGVWRVTKADGSDADRSVSELPVTELIQVLSWRTCLCTTRL